MKPLHIARGERRFARRAGVTLVEVMLAVVVLALIAVGGSAFMFQSRATIAEQGRKRMAHDIANARLEEIRAIPWTSFTNRVHALSGVQSLLRAEDGTLQLGGLAYEEVPRNGYPYYLETRISRRNDLLFDLEVSAFYNGIPADAPRDFVRLHTRYLPEIDYF